MSISFPKKVIFVLPRAAWPSYAGQAKHAVALGSSYKQLGITTVLISIGMNVSRQNLSGMAELSKAFDEVISIDLHLTSLLQAGMMWVLSLFTFRFLPLQTFWISHPSLLRSIRTIFRTHVYHSDSSADTVFHLFSLRTFFCWQILDKLNCFYLCDLIDSSYLNLSSRLETTPPLSHLLFAYEINATRKLESSLPISRYCIGYNVVSPLDKSFLGLSRAGLSRIFCTSIGINSDSSQALKVNSSPNTTCPNILFFGSLSYWPNVDAARFFITQVLPDLAAKIGSSFVFVLAGRNPSKNLKLLVESSPSCRLVANPIDMQIIVSEALFTVAPIMHGSGQQNKILESIMWGTPVITTQRCADVLGFTNGVQLLVANTPSEYVSACLKLYGDPALRHHLVFEGQKSVRERFSWNSVSKQMLNNYSCRFIP